MVVVLAQQNRNAGTYRSNPQATTKIPDGQIVATAILGSADLQDATLAVTMGVEVNDTPNAGANDPGWFVLSSADWHGGAQTRNGTFPPPTTTAPSDITQPTVRGFMTVNKRTNIGVDIVIG